MTWHLWLAVMLTWVEWRVLRTAYLLHRAYKISQEGLDKPE